MADVQTQTAYELHALNVSARASTTRTQSRAIDLHKRGFNVFPLPYGSKEPFKNTSLKRLYNSRLHLCGDGVEPCRHGKGVPTFASLFTGQKNFAVMCGKTSGNLLAVDCDSQTAYDAIGKELDALALPYWAFTSHRGGAYLLRILEGEAGNVAKIEALPDVQLWGNSHYVVVPLSVHPSGTVYRWRGDTEPAYHYANEYETLPAVSIDALGWLGVTLQAKDKPQRKPLEMFGLSAEYAALSERNRETLSHGATEGARNSRLTALAYDLAANFDRANIEAEFLKAAAVCEPSYTKRDALAILKSAYRKERTPAKGANAGAVVDARIQRLYVFVNSYDWRQAFGRKARTRRAVFVACVDRSAIEGETFRASVRELAESVNRSFQYVGLCLRDLQTAGLLRLVSSWGKSASGANVYAFGDAVKHYCQKETVITTCNNNVSFWQYEKNTKTDEYKDVFGLKGLGAVAGEVLKALQAKKYKSVYEIAKDTGAAYSSVKRAVQKLVTHGLAIHSEAEGMLYAEPVTEDALLALSVRLETNGRAEMQRIRHGIDREIFVNRSMSAAVTNKRR
jgi:predicted transcriptional regulator